MNIIINKPRNFTADQLQDFIILVETGGENVPGYAASTARTAEYLALVYEDETPIASAAIKHPRESYRDSCFDKAGLDLEPERFNLELGFCFVIPEKRNTQVASRMLNMLLKQEIPSTSKVFATTRTDNQFMIKILTHNNYIAMGDSWLSIVNRANRIQLYLKNNQIREHLYIYSHRYQL